MLADDRRRLEHNVGDGRSQLSIRQGAAVEPQVRVGAQTKQAPDVADLLCVVWQVVSDDLVACND
jgi:hypothetical protein